MNGNKVYNRNPTSEEMPSSSENSSTPATESSSDSGNTEKISTPPSTKHQKNRNNIQTPSKPSSSIKRPREPEEKGAGKPSSKKSKKPGQGENKGKAAESPEPKKSIKKGGQVWNAKDEAAFLKRLLACCEKGEVLSYNLGVFYDAVKKDLEGDYSNEQLYNKFRGLKMKFKMARGKAKDKGFVGFKNAHEENLYRLSSQIWGNKDDEEEEIGTEKAGKGGGARVGKKKKKKNLVADPRREREHEDVDKALKEQEGEEEEHEDALAGEEGEGLDQGEQNANVNLSQVMKTKKKKDGISHVFESVHNKVADTGTQRSMGEDEISSEDNGGEEKDSSEESEESESADDDNSTLRDANIALEQSNVRENSTPHVSNVAAAGHHDARKKLSRPFQNGRMTNLPNNEENLAQVVPTNGSPCAVTTEQNQMFDRLCKESVRVVNGQMQDMLSGFKNEIVNFVNTSKREAQRSSNTLRATGFDFSMINGISSGWELPSLSKTEAEMLDQKWQTQQFIEMEAASKHLALLQEEYQLRMSKLRHQ